MSPTSSNTTAPITIRNASPSSATRRSSPTGMPTTPLITRVRTAGPSACVRSFRKLQPLSTQPTVVVATTATTGSTTNASNGTATRAEPNPVTPCATAASR